MRERRNICPEYGVGQSGKKVWEDRLNSCGSVKERLFCPKVNGKHLFSLKLSKRQAKFDSILLFVNKFH